METFSNTSDNLNKFLTGENKPVILFEFTYMNIAVMAVAIILIIVISKMITKVI